ncbi:MAG: hypothetical protein FJ403_14465 [Verrucomicrobia bacterium]|nr:hypothetical protein [Verrucomicrobiota bacterium]
MKNNSLATFLVALLALSVAATAVLSYTYVQSMRRLQFLQAHGNQINQSRQMLQRLVTDAVEYSKHNPAIEPILESVGIHVKPDAAPNGPSTNTPSQLPSSKK